MTECVERSWRSILILGLLRGLLDQSRYFFGTRFVDRMARALDHDHVAVGARGIEPLQVGIDDLVRVRHERPAQLHLPGRISNREFPFDFRTSTLSIDRTAFLGK